MGRRRGREGVECVERGLLIFASGISFGFYVYIHGLFHEFMQRIIDGDSHQRSSFTLFFLVPRFTAE